MVTTVTETGWRLPCGRGDQGAAFTGKQSSGTTAQGGRVKDGGDALRATRRELDVWWPNGRHGRLTRWAEPSDAELRQLGCRLGGGLCFEPFDPAIDISGWG